MKNLVNPNFISNFAAITDKRADGHYTNRYRKKKQTDHQNHILTSVIFIVK